MKIGTTTTDSTEYIVTFGPKKESERETKTFSDYDKAAEFFSLKDKVGFHVDAYEVNTKVVEVVKKLG